MVRRITFAHFHCVLLDIADIEPYGPKTGKCPTGKSRQIYYLHATSRSTQLPKIKWVVPDFQAGMLDTTCIVTFQHGAGIPTFFSILSAWLQMSQDTQHLIRKRLLRRRKNVTNVKICTRLCYQL